MKLSCPLQIIVCPFGHCVVCLPSIPLWHLQTFITYRRVISNLRIVKGFLNCYVFILFSNFRISTFQMIFAIIHFQSATSKYNVNQYSNLLCCLGGKWRLKSTLPLKFCTGVNVPFFLGDAKFLSSTCLPDLKQCIV